jgi:hypothetical protein
MHVQYSVTEHSCLKSHGHIHVCWCKLVAAVFVVSGFYCIHLYQSNYDVCTMEACPCIAGRGFGVECNIKFLSPCPSSA